MRPPRASSFSVEPIPSPTTDSDEELEVLDSLLLGAMFFADPERLTSAVPWPINEWKTHYPYWDEPNVLPRERMGDCYAMIVDTILTLASPFPGDTLYDAKHISQNFVSTSNGLLGLVTILSGIG